MGTDLQTAPVSKKMLWAGWVISVLPALMMVMSAVMKFSQSEEMAKQFTHLGYDPDIALKLGILELTCTIIYLIPRTAVLGAILLTGYMGGAIATHVRLGEPVYVHIGLGVAFWLGIYLRDARLRALLPFRS